MDRIDKEIYLGDSLYSIDYNSHGTVASLDITKKELVIVFNVQNHKITRAYNVSDLGASIFFNISDICPNRNPYIGRYRVYFRQRNRKVQQHIDYKDKKPVTPKTKKSRTHRKHKIKPSWTYLPYVVGEPHVEDHDFFPIRRRKKKN